MRRGNSGVRHALPLSLFLVIAFLTACNLPLTPSGNPPRPTVVVVTATGPYAETFDDLRDDWLLGDTDNSAGRVEAGEYIMSIKQPNLMAWTHNSRIFGDAVYEFDARFISGPEASAYGLILLATSDLRSFLYVMITDDGRYDIGICEEWCGTQQSMIGDLTVSYSILPGEESNHIRVQLQGGTLSLAINGAPVSQIQGIPVSTGLVGFVGQSSQFGGFEAAFDNLTVVEFDTPTAIPLPVTAQPTPTTPGLIEPSPAP